MYLFTTFQLNSVLRLEICAFSVSTYLVFLAFLEVKIQCIRKTFPLFMQMHVCSVPTISGLDSQSKFQMCALFSGRHVGVQIGITATWRLCKSVQNISTNI